MRAQKTCSVGARNTREIKKKGKSYFQTFTPSESEMVYCIWVQEIISMLLLVSESPEIEEGCCFTSFVQEFGIDKSVISESQKDLIHRTDTTKIKVCGA